MTEDDTFRVLTRTPFIEVMAMYRTGIGKADYCKWFLSHGWYWKEFAKKWEEWNGGIGTSGPGLK